MAEALSFCLAKAKHLMVRGNRSFNFSSHNVRHIFVVHAGDHLVGCLMVPPYFFTLPSPLFFQALVDTKGNILPSRANDIWGFDVEAGLDCFLFLSLHICRYIFPSSIASICAQAGSRDDADTSGHPAMRTLCRYFQQLRQKIRCTLKIIPSLPSVCFLPPLFNPAIIDIFHLLNVPRPSLPPLDFLPRAVCLRLETLSGAAGERPPHAT